VTIVCGTDFSDFAATAVDAAAALAAASKQELVLVHALDFPGAEAAGEWSLLEAERKRTTALLASEAARAGAGGAAVRTEIRVGASDVELVAVAAKEGARLVVVGAIGRRGDSLWRLGSTADRVAQSARAPVLVVREAETLVRWVKGGRTLEVNVAVDSTPSSDAAVTWVGELESAGPCRVTCVHVYWPPEQKEPSKVPALERDLRARIEALRGGRRFELRILGGLGRTADHLASVAEETKADLVVVGARQRSGIARFWTGSVSRGVMDLATTNVVCVGRPAE